MAAALRDHRIVGGDHAVEHPLDVDIDAAFPRFMGGLVVGDEGQRHDPGIVDHHVDPPESVGRTGNQRLDLGQFAHVNLRRLGLPATRADFCCGGFGGGKVDVAQRHHRAPRGGLQRDEPAKAAARAGDDDGLAGNVIGHGGSSQGLAGSRGHRTASKARRGGRGKCPLRLAGQAEPCG